jgi:hypothetical protein
MILPLAALSSKSVPFMLGVILTEQCQKSFEDIKK